MKIIKRDSRVKNFSFSRIEKAVDNAFSEVYSELDYSRKMNEVLSNVMEEIIELDVEVISVEEIQDIIIDKLSDVDEVVAKSYREYRDIRSFEREKRSDSNYEIEKIINSTSEESTSNGNVDGSKIQSIRALVANVFTRKYAEWRYIPLDLQKKQRKELYYHDAQYVGMPFFNCCNVEWQDMFRTGFELGTAKIETPKSLATAVNVLTQVASHISSNTYGGTTFGNLGEGLLPYAKKSLQKHRDIANEYVIKERAEEYAWQRLEKEIKDSIQSLEYEIQTLVTSRGETPFLTLGLDIPREDYSEEDRKIHNMIIEAILKQRFEGLSGGVTPVFPKLVFQLKRGVNLDRNDKEYEMFKLASKVSAKRQYPDYVMSDRLKEVTGGFKFPIKCLSA